MEESDGVCSTQTAAGSDTAEGTQNNTVLTSTNGRGGTCYSGDTVRDDIVTRARDLPSIRSGSRWYGSSLVALVMDNVRGMTSES
jgi:hypothetical protein